MDKENEGMPFVPEEDLNLHENFQPIIAENGLIRPQEPEDFTPLADATFTRMDTVQDLVELRKAEEKQKEAKSQDTPPAQEKTAENTAADKIEQAPAEPALPAQDAVQQPPAKPAPVQEPAPVQLSQQSDTAQQPAPQEKQDQLPVAAALNTALATLPVLPTLSGSKPPKKKDKKNKRKKAARTSFQTDKKPDTLEEKPTPGPKKPSRWPIVVAVICFLFLGTVTGVMPVEKIPFLRNLAYAMGFTKTDTARMSFLRALLTWTDNTVGIPGVLGGSGLRGSWWARLWGKSPLTEDPANTPIASLSSRLQSGANSKTSLIDIAALQALQRQTGRQPDSIRGAVPPNSGDETQPNPAPVRDSDVNVRTESNQDKSDVYFGSDASAQGRNMQDGYDSSGTLKKLANPHVANGRRIDWMTNTAHRMIQLDAGLGGLNRQLSHASVNWQTGIQSMGEEKPHRDLYHAWITSRMAKYTSNLMLSKALADTGFMGAEMPTTAANVLTGGVQVDVQSFQEDQEAWKEYLEFEKKCKKEQEVSGGRLENSKQEFRKLVTTNKETNWDFPKNCVESRKDKRSYESTKFYESLSQVQGICKQLDSAYKKLESECRMVINYTPCKDIRNDYKGHWEKFSSNCNKYFEEDFEKWWEAEGKKKYQQLIEQQGEQAARKQAQNDFENNAWANTYGTRHTEEEYVRGLTNNGSTMVDVVVEQNGGASGYMPSVDPAASIKQYLEENKAM